MPKTAYEIETELMGSGVNRTGFGGRPELINFYVEDGDLSPLPKLEKLSINYLRCGKAVPVLTVLDQNGHSKTFVCDVEVTVADDAVTAVKFIAGEISMTFTVETGEWAIDE